MSNSGCTGSVFFFFFFLVSIFNMVFLSSLKEAEKPFCERLHRVRDLMDRSKVSIEEVISELGQYLFLFLFLSFQFLLIFCQSFCVHIFMFSISNKSTYPDVHTQKKKKSSQLQHQKHFANALILIHHTVPAMIVSNL